MLKGEEMNEYTFRADFDFSKKEGSEYPVYVKVYAYTESKAQSKLRAIVGNTKFTQYYLFSVSPVPENQQN